MRRFVPLLVAAGLLAVGLSTNAGATPSARGYLYQVACTSSASCTAVGGSTAGPLILHWNGSKWSAVASPGEGNLSNLLSIACPNARSCTAVGHLGVASALIEHWNGLKWSVVKGPSLPKSESSVLSGVACTSVTTCTAVGEVGGFDSSKTLVEQGHGSTWKIVKSPSVAPSSDLSGIACTGADSCIAAGNVGTFNDYRTLVEAWNGTSWKIVKSPNDPGLPSSSLFIPFCTSAKSCTAVGNSTSRTGTPSVTLVERRSGATWKIVRSPNITGTTDYLFGLACRSSSSCMTVGVSEENGTGASLVEHWNGSSWSIMTSPNVSKLGYNYLEGVTCTSGSNCWAVGNSTAASANATLIEHWNGKRWSIVKSPN